MAKMPAFSLMILEGISVSWDALETSRLKISLNISSSATSENEKAACVFFLSLHITLLTNMLRCFLYFSTSLIIGSLISSEIGSLVTYSGILRLPTIFEKKISKTWTVFSSFETISFPFINFIFSLDVILSERKGLTVFQKALLSVIFFSSRFL